MQLTYGWILISSDPSICPDCEIYLKWYRISQPLQLRTKDHNLLYCERLSDEERVISKFVYDNHLNFNHCCGVIGTENHILGVTGQEIHPNRVVSESLNFITLALHYGYEVIHMTSAHKLFVCLSMCREYCIPRPRSPGISLLIIASTM